MKLSEYRETLQSQINRYGALLNLTQGLPEEFNCPPSYLYTLTEDAAEYARHLMIDLCGVEVTDCDLK